jgi:signal peptidase I
LRGLIKLVYQAAVFVTALRITVDGWSMHPTLSPGEHVLFNRLAYIRNAPKSGDVVLAHSGDKIIIKQVVGVSGDIVKLIYGVMTVNATRLKAAALDGEGEWLLKQDEYFLLGKAVDMNDVDMDSIDSRSFGPVTRKAIKARAWLVYWPIGLWRNLDTE